MAPAAIRRGSEGRGPQCRRRGPSARRGPPLEPRGDLPGLGCGARISTAGGRGLHLVWPPGPARDHLFGPREGKQQTVRAAGRVDTRRSGILPREEALARAGPALLHQPRAGHGAGFRLVVGPPAARRGRGNRLACESGSRRFSSKAGPTGCHAPTPPCAPPRAPCCCPPSTSSPSPTGTGAPCSARRTPRRAQGLDLLRPAIVVNGRVVGHWSRPGGPRGESDSAGSRSPSWRDRPRARSARGTRRYATFLETGAPMPPELTPARRRAAQALAADPQRAALLPPHGLPVAPAPAVARRVAAGVGTSHLTHHLFLKMARDRESPAPAHLGQAGVARLRGGATRPRLSAGAVWRTGLTRRTCSASNCPRATWSRRRTGAG